MNAWRMSVVACAVLGAGANCAPDDSEEDEFPQYHNTSSSGGTTASTSMGPSDQWPAAGNPNPEGQCAIPAGGGLEDVSNPKTVVGNGTPESCTSNAFVTAVAAGGVITFNCGPNSHTITLGQTAKIVNNTGPRIVIDGGG